MKHESRLRIWRPQAHHRHRLLPFSMGNVLFQPLVKVDDAQNRIHQGTNNQQTRDRRKQSQGHSIRRQSVTIVRAVHPLEGLDDSCQNPTHAALDTDTLGPSRSRRRRELLPSSQPEMLFSPDDRRKQTGTTPQSRSEPWRC